MKNKEKKRSRLLRRALSLAEAAHRVTEDGSEHEGCPHCTTASKVAGLLLADLRKLRAEEKGKRSPPSGQRKARSRPPAK